MMMERHRFTTFNALVALERAVAGARGCPRAWGAPVATQASFWKEVADAPPPEGGEAHARKFEAMERYGPLLDAATDALGRALRALGRALRVAATGLRAAARRLDATGRSLIL